MATYRTLNGQQIGFVPGVGEIVAGQIEAPENWQHNSNFEKVVPAVAPQQPSAPAAPSVSNPAVPPVSPAADTQNTNTNVETK